MAARHVGFQHVSHPPVAGVASLRQPPDPDIPQIKKHVIKFKHCCLPVLEGPLKTLAVSAPDQMPSVYALGRCGN